MSIKSLLASGKERLALSDISAVDAELLLAHALGVGRMELHSRTFDLSAEELANLTEEFDRQISLRISGMPTQYIIGSAPFRYLEYEVGPGVLIPRPETESLVDEVLHQISRMTDPISLIDLGSGSGVIPISIISETLGKKKIHAIAVENSPEAVHWLKQNIARHDCDVRVVESDVSSALIGVKADIVTANPPYIPEAQALPPELAAEPRVALIGGGADGMEIPALFIAAATRLLKSGGLLALEHHEEQGEAIAALLEAECESIALHNDLAGRARFTTAIRR